jgi:hypothetical protein
MNKNCKVKLLRSIEENISIQCLMIVAYLVSNVSVSTGQELRPPEKLENNRGEL